MSLATYLFEINSKEDFAKCSNFLCKYVNHENLSRAETEKIYFKISSRETAEKQNSIYKLLNQREQFTEIGRPIQNFHTEYEIQFLIHIDGQALQELVLYQEAILILASYISLPVYCVAEGDENFYYKLSQYLFCVIREMELGDKFFYWDRKDKFLKRMQVNNLYLSTSFFPLLLITSQNLNRLRSGCITQLGEKSAKNIFLDKTFHDAENVQWPELEGIVKLFRANKKVFDRIDGEDLFDIIAQIDTLSLILLSYSMKNLSKWHECVNNRELRKYVDTIQQYADACFQLLENILFHSDAGWGLLSVRIHRPDERADIGYIKQHYGISGGENTYFELIIRDYSGSRSSGNIADHFQQQVKIDEWKMFEGLKPKNLFCSSLGDKDKFEEAWKRFYHNSDHIGKHFGLRIFQRIVSEYEGYFRAESHRSHQYEEGDHYHYRLPGDPAVEHVMPGTAYHILLPLKIMQRQIFETDMTQEYGNWLCSSPEELFHLQAHEFTGFQQKDIFRRQSEKERYIQDKALQIREFAENKKDMVLAIDAAGEEGRMAELYVKALMVALYSLETKPCVIIYGCSGEFADQYKILMKALYAINLEAMFDGTDFQIILLSDHYSETVFVPGSIRKTDGMNLYVSRMKGVKCSFLIRQENMQRDMAEFAASYIPADILIQREGRTLFQECVEGILKGDIQGEQFGCKISNVHMRLGSTIHINHFFEAEILFGVKYFRTRFAFLILCDMFEILKKETAITLYGYASYSEPLLVELRNVTQMLNPETDVDYIVLEREEERRGLTHTDKIRYSRQERKIKQEDEKRKYIVIVPINSTLKTHQRLINLLQEEERNFSKEDVVKNYALILVGTEKANDYWERVGNHELKCKIEEIQPLPQYYVDVNIEYYEPMTCSLCFPAQPLLEEPLIETNAASTIPNQAFGIVEDKIFDQKNLKNISGIIKREEKKLAVLEDCFWYGHYRRNDGHYLYYCRTDKLVTAAARQIQESLEEWRKHFRISENEYHILVVPMHFSNCGFVEMVNDVVFSGMASILRIDFNKEFRSNAYAKFSYIRQYIQQLNEREEAYVRFHFVDDNIITGRTYFRAKSLIESIVDMAPELSGNVHIQIFDRVFVLIDRNSKDTKSQYISPGADRGRLEDYYYVYLQLEISSLRNYGDSCIICNLYQEAELLNSTASTKIMEDYWRAGEVKFGLKTIEEREADKKDAEYQKRAFRRLVTTHIVKVALRELGYNHKKENALRIILGLLVQDFRMRESQEEAFEYFVSYLKVISRPFLAFDKAVKEAVFDILLNTVCCMIDKQYDSMEKKAEWEKDEIKNAWLTIRKHILDSLSDGQKKDLVLVVMKQLTELKSNYIIRKRSIECFYQFIDDKGFSDSEKEDFWRRYHVLVKRLTGTSSDTSKSYWLDHLLYTEAEYGVDSKETLPWPQDVREMVILENTRNFRDGIDKIYNRLLYQEEELTALKNYIHCLMSEEYHNYCLYQMAERQKENLLSLPETKYREQMQYLLTDNCACVYRRLENMFKHAKVTECTEKCLEMLKDPVGWINEIDRPLDVLNSVYSREDYQYKNFQGFCEEIGWFRNQRYTQEGIREIAGCLGMKHLCRHVGENGWEAHEKLREFVNLASEILNHCHVQLLIECENSAEYYAELINKYYQGKIAMYEKDAGELTNVRRRYTELASSTGSSVYLEDAVQRLLNQSEVMFKLQKYGYYLGKEYFVWELGCESEFPAYLCARFDWDARMVYRIRNLMMFKWELENSIFDVKRSGYLHELAVANNRLELYKGRKTVSHTDLEGRRNKFQALARKGSQLADNNDMLILLADLRVSDIYRQSLNREFYRSRDRFTDICWKTEWNTLHREQIVTELTGNGEASAGNEECRDTCEQKKKEVAIEGSKEYDKSNRNVVTVRMGNDSFQEEAVPDDAMLTATSDTADELFSLLLALVLNPQKEKRGVAASDGKMEVYISKTARDTVRIANLTECGASVLSGIRRGLEHEPIREEDGITLWSMNCYLKRVKVAYARRFLDEAGEDPEKMEAAKQKILKLFENEFRIKIDIIEQGGKRFFSCEIPILSEKYEKIESGRSSL